MDFVPNILSDREVNVSFWRQSHGNVAHLAEQKCLWLVSELSHWQWARQGCRRNNFSHQQACRGDKHDDAVIAHDSTDSSSESLGNKTEVDAACAYTLPAGADFIMCYSVAQGKF